MTPGVRLEIGELALHGVPVSRPQALGPAFEAALTRLLRDRGVPPAWSDGAPGPPDRPLTVTLPRDANPEALAERLAAAVYERLAG